jgi:hypothetical protein
VGLFAGQKWCISWKPRKHAFWPSPEGQEPFSMLPRHALSSFMVWNAEGGPWWATAIEIKKTRICAQLSSYKSDSTRCLGCEFTIYNDDLTSGGAVSGPENQLCNPNNPPKALVFSSFPAKRGAQNRTLTPDPWTFTKMSPMILQTPLVS